MTNRTTNVDIYSFRPKLFFFFTNKRRKNVLVWNLKGSASLRLRAGVAGADFLAKKVKFSIKKNRVLSCRQVEFSVFELLGVTSTGIVCTKDAFCNFFARAFCNLRVAYVCVHFCDIFTIIWRKSTSGGLHGDVLIWKLLWIYLCYTLTDQII